MTQGAEMEATMANTGEIEAAPDAGKRSIGREKKTMTDVATTITMPSHLLFRDACGTRAKRALSASTRFAVGPRTTLTRRA